ncbi:MAG: hypothetical protein V3574_04770 [Candidatus Moraniibacteriota bacterium]
MKKDLNKNKDIAIKVDHVSKTFRIPHEKITSLRGAVVSGLSSVHLPILGGGQGGGSSYEEFKVYPVVSVIGALDDGFFEKFTGLISKKIYDNIRVLKPPALTPFRGTVGFIFVLVGYEKNIES